MSKTLEIKQFNGPFVVDVEVRSGETAYDLCRQIHDLHPEHPSPDTIRLVYFGRVLASDDLISSVTRFDTLEKPQIYMVLPRASPAPAPSPTPPQPRIERRQVAFHINVWALVRVGVILWLLQAHTSVARFLTIAGFMLGIYIAKYLPIQEWLSLSVPPIPTYVSWQQGLGAKLKYEVVDCFLIPFVASMFPSFRTHLIPNQH